MTCLTTSVQMQSCNSIFFSSPATQVFLKRLMKIYDLKMRDNAFAIKPVLFAAIAMMLAACGGGGDSSTATNAASSSPPTASAGTSTSAEAVSTLRITGTPSKTATLGSPYYFNASVTGNKGSTLTFSIQNKPEWITFNTLTGELKGTPDNTGTFPNITIKASDGHSTATLAPFSIRVADDAQLRVTLTWAAPTQNMDGSTLNNLSGFAIHYGVSPTNLDKVVKVASSSARSYLFNDLSKGKTYYFAVAAVNDADVEGALSPVTTLKL